MLTKQTNYTNLRQNLASILDEAISDRNVIVVTRQGKEDVAILAADELSNILETLHLFRSPANAQKLIAAMERADAISNKQNVKSESLAELCQELNIEGNGRVVSKSVIFDVQFRDDLRWWAKKDRKVCDQRSGFS